MDAVSFKWWASPESNRAPTDYAYHFDFHRPFRVRGLDCLLPFGSPVQSLHLPPKRLGSGLPRIRRGFPEFERFYQGTE